MTNPTPEPYTPPDDRVLLLIAEDMVTSKGMTNGEAVDAVRRWLAAHDREVWDEGYELGRDYQYGGANVRNPYKTGANE